MDNRERFTAWFRATYPDAPEPLETILRFGEELLRVNNSLALVSRGDAPMFWTRHVQECIPTGLLKSLAREERLLDVGSGNGLPGMVLAIMLPELQVTLLEPRHKKAGFLERMRLLLQLANVRVEQGALGDLAQGTEPEYPAIISRALAWTPKRVAELEVVATAQAILYRFGPRSAAEDEIPTGERAIHRLPRSVWSRI